MADVGLFISFEGGEGSGKTEQTDRLACRLRERGYSVVPVHEPGTTELGQYLRKWLKSNRVISHGTELFLFAAARSELVATFIKPQLQRAGTIIVADRYADSTTAYQGYGRGLKLEQVRVVNGLATQGVWPDLTVLLDLDPEVGLDRVGRPVMQLTTPGDRFPQERRRGEESQLKFELESLAFHRRVREGYLKLARAQPERWCVVDASQKPDVVAECIWERVSSLLHQRMPPGESLLREKA